MATYRQLKSGKWQARVSEDGKEFSIGTYRTKKEAKIAAASAEEKIYYGHTLDDKEKAFKDLAEEWLHNYMKNNLKASTFRNYVSAIEHHILPYFGEKKVVRVKRSDIIKWLNDYAESYDKNGKPKYSHGSRKRFLSILKSIFHYAAYELEILEKDPSKKLKAPVKDKAGESEEVKYFSLNELNQLLDYMEGYRHQRFSEYRLYYVLMYFLSQTGLRISEALALRWEDLNGDKLTVERQTSRDDNNKVVITSLKNSSSYRTIKLDQDVLKELKKFKLVQNQMLLQYTAFKQNEDGIIFQNCFGNYLTPSTIRESMQRYCRLAGVSYKGTHGFRHTHAVLLLEAGATIKYVSQRLGHKTIKTTADTYLDITDKIEEDELQKFASYTRR
ncbi:tyrosine-type recombinase/integrase [Salibacterium lacus]|uniref:Tyrosine-type recombinase/integrase n=1 Tax=Salibacterium lacus TaxID=1898109 RepID=A0ABW5T148_9BACI